MSTISRQSSGLISQVLAPDARVGQHDVHPAELLDPAIEDRLNLVVIAGVTYLRKDLAADLFDLAHGFLQILLGGTGVGRRRRLRTQVETDDAGSLASQRQGVRAALTARDTRDERDFAVKLSH